MVKAVNLDTKAPAIMVKATKVLVILTQTTSKVNARTLAKVTGSGNLLVLLIPSLEPTPTKQPLLLK